MVYVLAFYPFINAFHAPADGFILSLDFFLAERAFHKSGKFAPL